MSMRRKREDDVHSGSWTDTTLWALLSKKKDSSSSTRTFLESCMDDIESVLAKGGTGLVDFTLHDEDHSFRVAQRMVQVMPEKMASRLSSPELGLLLLSAYLHDIGMTPQRGKVRAYYIFLLTGAASSLEQADRDEFQAWLDEDGRDIKPPLAKGTPTEDELRLADELVAYFARHKHNDWSKEYIEENLRGRKWKDYEGWMDDLIDLCQSHHWGYSRLANESFDPKLLPSGDEVIHLRYLACVLRIADILENDPERTPDIIFRHRDIAKRSEIYWQKDHGVRVEIGKNRSITVRATPKQAVFHRAILQTASAIEVELRLCDRLNAEKPFKHLPKHEDLPHEWDLKESVFTEVRPYKESYEYIEGAFRPDTQRVLQMLGGIELYGNPLAAVRELLQNAFDAVRESIARERLALPAADNPADSKWAIEFGNRHEVKLTFEVDSEGREWLVCRDDGIGMTKEIIENYLLVSGNPRRTDVISLERQCELRGFSSERTGRFGIGVLSYFIIADQVRIKTRRSQIAGDADVQAWTFTSNGVGDFGELRRTPPTPSVVAGTEVALRLKKGLGLGFESHWLITYKISDYVAKQIVWLPCRLSILDTTDPSRVNSWAAGWVVDLSLDAPEEAKSSTAIAYGAGFLPEELGRYRVSVQHFRLKGGPSLGFFREQVNGDAIHILSIGNYDCQVPRSKSLFSYKGIRLGDEKLIPNPISLPANCTIQIDWTTERAGDISVDRTRFQLSAIARSAFESLCDQLKAQLSNILKSEGASKYEILNAMVGRFDGPAPAHFDWIEPSEGGKTACWQPVRFPAIFIDDNAFLAAVLSDQKFESLFDLMRDSGDERMVVDAFLELFKPQWQGQSLTPLRRLEIEGSDEGFWNLHSFPPDKLLVAKTPIEGVSLVPLWLKPPVRNSLPFTACDFPEAWKNVLAVFRLKTMFMNRQHPLCMWQSEFIEQSEPAGRLRRLLDDRPPYLDSLITSWNALDLEVRSKCLRGLWGVVASSVEPSDVVILRYNPSDKLTAMTLSASTGEAKKIDRDVPSVVPDAGSERLQFPSLDIHAVLAKTRGARAT